MKKIKVGLALGSGAARGLAHIGVLKVFEEENIPIDMIAGSSIGALIGALYCSNCRTDMLIKLAKHLEKKFWLDFCISRKGLIIGNKVEEMIRLLTKNRNFEELDRKLFVVATDLYKGEKVIIKEGNIAKAVRASIAVPGIFLPVDVNGALLIDGGVLERIPVGVLKEEGCDIVIGVDVAAGITGDMPSNIFEIIIESIDLMSREITKYKVMEADLILKPDVKNINPALFNKVDECIEAGIKVAKENVEKIKELINSKYNGFSE